MARVDGRRGAVAGDELVAATVVAQNPPSAMATCPRSPPFIQKDAAVRRPVGAKRAAARPSRFSEDIGTCPTVSGGRRVPTRARKGAVGKDIKPEPWVTARLKVGKDRAVKEARRTAGRPRRDRPKP